jgi:ATP-dependent Clp protease adaptor protein ClpS
MLGFANFVSANHQAMWTDIEIEEELDVEAIEKLKDTKEIILHNDDFNTFDFVIDTLVKICKHTVIQAEQCAHIVHFNGKCSVKKGEFEKLRPICEALLDRGLTAEIS